VVRRAPYHADAHLLENPPLDIVEGSEHGDSLVTGNFLPALGQRQGGGAPLIGLPCEQTERGGLWRDEWAVSKRPWSMPPHQPCQQLGEVAPVAWGLEAAESRRLSRAARSSVDRTARPERAANTQLNQEPGGARVVSCVVATTKMSPPHGQGWGPATQEAWLDAAQQGCLSKPSCSRCKCADPERARRDLTASCTSPGRASPSRRQLSALRQHRGRGSSCEPKHSAFKRGTQRNSVTLRQFAESNVCGLIGSTVP
jgi:hypothetical protein